LVTNNGIHAAKTHAFQPGFWARNEGDGWKLGSRWRASASNAADAITITRSPTMVQTASPRLSGTSRSLLRHSLNVGAGSSRHAIALPNVRIGARTTTVPLTYQPKIGEIPKESRSHGITTATVSHSDSEKNPNNTAVSANPIGGAMVAEPPGVRLNLSTSAID
jgi:hypothetical protein